MIQRTHSVGVILFKGSSVLLVKHTNKAKLQTGIYGFPAGRVEKGESFEDAAVRELKEETGLNTTKENLEKLPAKTSTMQLKQGDEHFIFQPFFCKKYSGDLKASIKTVPEFIDISSINDIPTIKDVQEIVDICYDKYVQK